MYQLQAAMIFALLGTQCKAFATRSRSSRIPTTNSPTILQSFPHRATPIDECSSVRNTGESASVCVLDNVFSSEACRLIHQLAVEHSDRASNCDGSSIFYRNNDNDAVYTPLERAIDSALTALGDTSEVVEYWSREEYINIDAHADIDEGGLLDDGDSIRCPKQGHILYLSVGEGVKGPTFIFPGKLVGWGCNDDNTRSTSSDGRSESTRKVEMVTVPAVEGRVVRFDGRALHAVPKTADRWILSDVEEAMMREKENDDWGRSGDNGEFWDDEEENDDDGNAHDADDEPIDRRSVLLFNTWKYGPAFVDEDPALHMPVGIELSDGDDGGPSDIISMWEEEYGPNAIKIRCNEQGQWKGVPILEADDGGAVPSGEVSSSNVVRVSLMGNRRRRCYPKKNVKLLANSAERLRSAVMESRDPTRFVLNEREL